MGNLTQILTAALGKKFWWLAAVAALAAASLGVLWPDSAALLLSDGEIPKPGSGG